MIHHSRNSHDGVVHLFAFCTVLLIGGVHLLRFTLRRWKLNQVVQDTPIVPLASAPQGFVEVQGYAWPTSTIFTSPVQGLPCVFYSVHLQQWRQSGKSGSWVTIYKKTTGESFYVVDSTGMALVGPDPGECTLNNKVHNVNVLDVSAKQRVFALAGRDIPFWSTGRFQVTEGTILAGSPVYVLGDLATKNNEAQIPHLSGAAEFIRLIKNANHPSLLELQKIDTNHDGKITSDEWAVYCSKTADGILSRSFSHGKVSGDTVSTSVSASTLTAPEFRCMGTLSSTTDHRVYFADCHKDELEKRLKSGFIYKVLGSALMIAFGAAGILYCLFGRKT